MFYYRLIHNRKELMAFRNPFEAEKAAEWLMLDRGGKWKKIDDNIWINGHESIMIETHEIVDEELFKMVEKTYKVKDRWKNLEQMN